MLLPCVTIQRYYKIIDYSSYAVNPVHFKVLYFAPSACFPFHHINLNCWPIIEKNIWIGATNFKKFTLNWIPILSLNSPIQLLLYWSQWYFNFTYALLQHFLPDILPETKDVIRHSDWPHRILRPVMDISWSDLAIAPCVCHPSLQNSTLYSVCLGVNLLVFIFLRIYSTSWICRFVSFINFGKFLTSVCSKNFSDPFSLCLPSGTPIVHMTVHLMVFHRSLRLC